MEQPPLWRRVVFVDWHGVLSRDPFWSSILQSDSHRLRDRLQAKLGDIFSQPLSHEWMKGVVTSEQIIEQMALQLPANYREDYLRRRLDDDCRNMRVNVALFKLLHRIRDDGAWVVIATDNMDCFKDTFDRIRSAPRAPRATAERFAYWVKHCDAIICSSDVQALKAEDPVGFFGPFLADWGLDFSDAALIDDRVDNCQAFAQQGGTALRYAMKSDQPSSVEEPLREWLHGVNTGAAVGMVSVG